MAYTNEQRGQIAAWLKEQRTARFGRTEAGVKAMVRFLKDEHGIAASAWKSMESGNYDWSRTPGKLEAIGRALGSYPPIEQPEDGADAGGRDGDLLAALRDNTLAVQRQAAATEAHTVAINRLIGVLLPLAARGIGLGLAEAEEVARAVGVQLDGSPLPPQE